VGENIEINETMKVDRDNFVLTFVVFFMENKMKFSIKRIILIASILGLGIFITSPCFSHYGMVIPSDNMIMQDEKREIKLMLSFSHPFELIGMELVKPNRFFVVKDGKTQELTQKLKPISIMGEKGWILDFPLKRPGSYAFVMEPFAYFEEAEDSYIIHTTKTIVGAFGDDRGWDEEVGLATEIIPLSRPFGLYAGNLFQGIVKMNGKRVPYAVVEVEFYNRKKNALAPNDYMITQVIKADQNGVFSYSAPVPGWWGFAALSPSDKKMMRNGEKKDIELGAVLWVKFENWREK
jgi:cobalt/nickel transport protein